MKNKLILLLLLALSLTSCKGAESPNSDELVLSGEISQSNKDESNIGKNASNEEKVQEKTRSKEEDEFFKSIENKKFFIRGYDEAIESIYFYQDGYFDGAVKNGNGYQIGVGLFDGKFDFVEKVDDLTYKIKLVRLENDPAAQKDEINIDGINVEVNNLDPTFTKKEDIGKEYLVHLPETKLESFGENQGTIEFLDEYIRDGEIKVYILEKLDDSQGFMSEFIKEN